MSKQPFEVLSNWDKSFDESGETSGSNEWVRNDQVAINYDSDEDELSETGDVGFGQHVYASYQKSGNKSVKGKDKLKMSEIDGFEEGDSVDINSSLKPRQCTTYMWLRHPQVRENWKTVAGAICLLIIGILFLICGIVLSAIPKHDGPKSIIFFVCAAVCILPGGYHTVYIYRATKGWRGYNFESLPSFR